jgi:hypothetical protein
MSSSRPSMNSRPLASKWPDVARRHQPVEEVLAATARVALELHLVADEDPPRGTRLGERPVRLVVDADDGPERRAPRGAGRLAQVLRRRDGRPGDFRRAVEVVEVLAERVHPALGDRGRKRGARHGDRAQLREVVGAQRRLRELEDALEHHGHGHQRGALVAGGERQDRFRIEPALEDERRDRAMPSVKWAKPHAWNSGAAIIVRPRALSGIRASRAAAGSSDLGWPRLAPLGVPVVPEVRMIALPSGAVEADPTRVPSGEVLERAVHASRVVAPGRVAPAARAGFLEDSGELVVVDERRGILAPRDVRELRPAERRVEAAARPLRASSTRRRLPPSPGGCGP